MNKEHLKVPQWIPGPPGTGKTSEWLFDKYVECLKKGIRWDRIVVLSHTNVAALAIIESVKKIPEMKDISKSKLDDQICTIHSYFKAEYVKIDKYEKKTLKWDIGKKEIKHGKNIHFIKLFLILMEEKNLLKNIGLIVMQKLTRITVLVH